MTTAEVEYNLLFDADFSHEVNLREIKREDVENYGKAIETIVRIKEQNAISN